MESLTQIFYEEANEMVEQMETILLAMEESSADPEVINALFRNAHSLKGNSGAMGFTNISHFTHGLENSLDVIRKGNRTLSKELTDLLLKGVDIIRNLLDASRTEGDVGDPACAQILGQLKTLVSSDTAALRVETPKVEPTPQVVTEPETQPEVEKNDSVDASKPTRYRVSFSSGRFNDGESDPLRSLIDLKDYVTILSSRLEEKIPDLRQLDPLECYATWFLDVETTYEPVMIRAVLELTGDGATVEIDPFEDSDEAVTVEVETAVSQITDGQSAKTTSIDTAAQAGTRKPAEAQTIRVATEKVDALFNLTSEIVIAQSMLSTTHQKVIDVEAKMAVVQMERHIRELHERVMAIRMIPVGFVFNRFPRMVRDLASSSGKEVKLEIAGEETELDRTLLESLTDPLTHLLRNSLDHGIEPPDQRVKLGKPPCGTVKLNAYQAEGRIHIEVTDDGRGIDIERIRQKAITLEWIKEDDHPSADALYEYLFRPGFSTAEVITDVSGRGVGMDVVKRNVDKLGGIVTVFSELGKGSRFLIKVPLTLAIMEGLNLRVGSEFFIVPLTSVVETFQPENVTLCSALGTYEMVNVRGKFLPLVKLCDSFQMEDGIRETSKGLLVILEQDDQQIALLADEIIGQQQVVMKSLEANFMRVPGFSGATILGDGHVALILDASDLIRRAQTAQTYQMDEEALTA
ncbi:MAG: chemotaxis protein CheA [bacterium]